MANAFNMDLRAQQEWSWMLAIWLFLGGTGTGLYLIYLVFGLAPVYGVVALGLVVVGGIDLLLELGSPFRAWRAVLRTGTSWLARGACCVFLFVIAAALSLGARLAVFSWLAPLETSPAGEALAWFAGLCAAIILLYPAFFFRSTSRAVPFWNTPLLPLLFVGYGLSGGTGVMLLMAPRTGAPAELGTLAAVLIVINAALVAIHLADMRRAGEAGRESLRLLNRSALAWSFWVGALGIGLVVPLVEIVFFGATQAVAGALILLGGLLFRQALLKAGVYAPPALVPAGIDLSRLNRTSADFEREYAGMASGRAGRSG